jgi:hypothetical protein
MFQARQGPRFHANQGVSPILRRKLILFQSMVAQSALTMPPLVSGLHKGHTQTHEGGGLVPRVNTSYGRLCKDHSMNSTKVTVNTLQQAQSQLTSQATTLHMPLVWGKLWHIIRVRVA